MTSRVRIVPFYDRTGLIEETLGTLQQALTNEVLVTVIVIVIMLMNLRSSLVVAGLLPLIVLVCFIGMKLFRVDANIVALSGIAIAIGTMVDMCVILIENIYRHLSQAGHGADRLRIVLSATREVRGAVITAVLTTVVSFLPVLTMDGAAGKLFRPLAFTKTIALIAAALVALWVLPPLAHAVYGGWKKGRHRAWMIYEGLVYAGALLAFLVDWRIGVAIAVVGAYHLVRSATAGANAAMGAFGRHMGRRSAGRLCAGHALAAPGPRKRDPSQRGVRHRPDRHVHGRFSSVPAILSGHLDRMPGIQESVYCRAAAWPAHGRHRLARIRSMLWMAAPVGPGIGTGHLSGRPVSRTGQRIHAAAGRGLLFVHAHVHAACLHR